MKTVLSYFLPAAGVLGSLKMLGQNVTPAWFVAALAIGFGTEWLISGTLVALAGRRNGQAAAASVRAVGQ